MVVDINELFHSVDFRALRVSLELRPLFKTWPDDAVVAYKESIIDELVEEERKERLNRDLIVLHKRKYVRKTKSDNLSIPFE